MIDFSNDELNKLKDNGEKLYKDMGSVYCPYFKEGIAFNSLGLEHLKFKRRGKARAEKGSIYEIQIIVTGARNIEIISYIARHFRNEKIREGPYS